MKSAVVGPCASELRRLARRGGVLRSTRSIEEEVVQALRDHLRRILGDCVAIAELRGSHTVRVEDVRFALQRQGTPLYH